MPYYVHTEEHISFKGLQIKITVYNLYNLLLLSCAYSVLSYFFLKVDVCVCTYMCFLVQVWPFLYLDEKSINSGNVNLDDKK